MKAYIAGPLFNEGERWFDEQIDAIAQKVGLETFLPHRDGKEMLPEIRDINAIFKLDRDMVDASDVVIANLNGINVDDGTAWEIGYAYAKAKHLVGIRTDMRLSFEGQVVNLMIECSLNHVVKSLDELESYLTTWLAEPT